MNSSQDTTTERIAITLLVDAEGLDARDRANVAVESIRRAFEQIGTSLSVPIYSGIVRRAEVVVIEEMNRALRDGALTVTSKPDRK